MRYQPKARIGDLPVVCVAIGREVQARPNRGVRLASLRLALSQSGAIAAGAIAIEDLGLSAIAATLLVE